MIFKYLIIQNVTKTMEKISVESKNIFKHFDFALKTLINLC